MPVAGSAHRPLPLGFTAPAPLRPLLAESCVFALPPFQGSFLRRGPSAAASRLHVLEAHALEKPMSESTACISISFRRLFLYFVVRDCSKVGDASIRRKASDVSCSEERESLSFPQQHNNNCGSSNGEHTELESSCPWAGTTSLPDLFLWDFFPYTSQE